MKKIIISVSALSALTALSVAAYAADLPARTAPSVLAPVATAYNWSGAYIGATAGYATNGNQVDYSYNAPSGPISTFIGQAVVGGLLPTQLGEKQNGKFTGGLTAGYNFQTGNFVYGLEADLSALGGGSSSSFQAVSPPAAIQVRPGPGSSYQDDTVTATSNTKGSANWLGTLRARAGMSFDRLFVFGTGGLAFGGVKSSTSLGLNLHCTADCLGGDANGLWSGSAPATKFGWALGGGAEFALTRNFTIKGEYLHYDLGHQSYTLSPDVFSGLLLPGVSSTVTTKISGDLFRAGVNYRF